MVPKAIKPCAICGNLKGNKRYFVREMMFGFRDEFPYIECSNCGCLQIEQVPENIEKYYPPQYYSLSEFPSKKTSPIRMWIRRQRLGYTLSKRGAVGYLFYKIFGTPEFPNWLIPNYVRSNYRILDVGSGAGNNLFILFDYGFQNLMGIDPYIAEDIYYPNGISIKKKDLGKVEDIFDLIMFHHSFEHLPNPLEVLVKIKRILGPGGALLIRMPTVNSFSWRHYRENWVNLDAPRHFFLQSIQSMQILAEKTGYSIKEYRFISTAFQFLGSEQYIRDITLMSEKSFIKGFEKSIFLKEDEERYEEKAKFLNSTQDGDEICYYLSKAI